MSSVNWKKIRTASQAKANIRHNDKEKRIQDNHSNSDIDKSKTHLNLSFTDMSYEEKCEAYDKRVSECKANMKRVRSDAITMISLNIKLPEGLVHASYDEQAKWCKSCYKVVEEFVGKENIVSATADFDEVHEYFNPDTKQMELSRPELDVKFIPAIDGKLNAKQWQTPMNMTSLNTDIELMTLFDYGMEFMTGKGGKNSSAENLKTQSAKAEYEYYCHKAEQKKRECSRAEQDYYGLYADCELLKQEIKELEPSVTHLNKRRSDFVELVKSYADDDEEVAQIENMSFKELIDFFLDELEEQKKKQDKELERRESLVKQKEDNLEEIVKERIKMSLKRRSEASEKLANNTSHSRLPGYEYY